MSDGGDTQPGTMIVGEEEIDDMERQLITGIAHDKNEAKITLTAVPDRPGAVAAIFDAAGRRQHQRRHDRAERRAFDAARPT